VFEFDGVELIASMFAGGLSASFGCSSPGVASSPWAVVILGGDQEFFTQGLQPGVSAA